MILLALTNQQGRSTRAHNTFVHGSSPFEPTNAKAAHCVAFACQVQPFYVAGLTTPLSRKLLPNLRAPCRGISSSAEGMEERRFAESLVCLWDLRGKHKLNI